MAEYKHRQRRHEDGDGDGLDQIKQTNQRDEKLADDVECCLAEIDELLEEAESERDKAIAEFREIRQKYISGEGSGEYIDSLMNLWQAKYAHLQLSLGVSCCSMYLYDDDTNSYIR